MKIKVVSDIHLEINGHIEPFLPKCDIETECEVLCLLGDIGLISTDIYSKFIEEQSKRYKHVIIIAGNHEYYNVSIELGNEILTKKVRKYNNVYFLNNDYVIINKVKFIGTTLWSKIPYEYYNEIMDYISDYRHIRKFKISDTNRLHELSVNYITNELNSKERKESKEYNKVVILTHHAPFMNSAAPHFNGKRTQHAYATDLTELVKDKEVALWAFGHVHWRNDIVINGTRFYSNCYGYKTEDTNGYDNKFIEI